jgi:uncharacterized phage protein gp47/JayE
MATIYPLPTLGCSITSTGISSPSYSDIYASLQASFQSIYGVDAYITPDSQDGQLLAIFARAQFDANSALIAAYNSFSPATSQGVALSNNVKINGIQRNVSSYSTVALTLVGQVGAVINIGVVGDANNNRWNLPTSVVLPISGSITVSAICQTPGSISAGVNSVNQILTPSLGWQTATNATVASAGAPVETDSALRQRQASSVALPSLTVLQGIVGSIDALTGVTQVKAFENDTGATDANGLPPHSIALVVAGGDVTQIATAIYLKKTPGAYTYGSTSVSIVDSFGISNTIRFFIPSPVPIKAAITIAAGVGYTSAIGDQIKQSVANYINALPIGQPVFLSRLYLPAQLNGGVGSETFELTILQISVYPAAVGSADVAIAFNQTATCLVANISLTVV